MVKKIIRIIAACLCFWLLWLAAQYLLAAMHAPAIAGTVVIVLGLLCVVLFIASEFELLGPPK